MQFDPPLIPARLIRRYKRFLADVTLEDGREVTAHVANPGKMSGLVAPGTRVWLEENDDPKRKLKYSWKIAESGGLVGVDTSLANRLVAEALQERRIPELAQYENIRTEVPYGTGSRIDFLLNETCYVEVKSVTFCRAPGLAEFPDTKTARGTKHMFELAKMAQSGKRAIVLYVVQRDDCQRTAVAGDIDPDYAAAFDQARAVGVEVLCHRCSYRPAEIRLEEQILFQP